MLFTDQNAVCRTNDRSNDLRHETDVISLRHSEQADIPLHRDDVKIARVLNLSHATGESMSPFVYSIRLNDNEIGNVVCYVIGYSTPCCQDKIQFLIYNDLKCEH